MIIIISEIFNLFRQVRIIIMIIIIILVVNNSQQSSQTQSEQAKYASSGKEPVAEYRNSSS